MLVCPLRPLAIWLLRVDSEIIDPVTDEYDIFKFICGPRCGLCIFEEVGKGQLQSDKLY